MNMIEKSLPHQASSKLTVSRFAEDHFVIEKCVNHCQKKSIWTACADKEWSEEYY